MFKLIIKLFSSTFLYGIIIKQAEKPFGIADNGDESEE